MVGSLVRAAGRSVISATLNIVYTQPRTLSAKSGIASKRRAASILACVLGEHILALPRQLMVSAHGDKTFASEVVARLPEHTANWLLLPAILVSLPTLVIPTMFLFPFLAQEQVLTVKKPSVVQ